MNGLGGHYAVWNKLDRWKTNILISLIYVIIKIEQATIMKKKQNHRYRKQTIGYGMGWEEEGRSKIGVGE